MKFISGTRFLKPGLLFIAAFLLCLAPTMVNAQSQAINGQIEGVVTDANGAAVPNANITVTNVETGTTRTVSTDASGVYRVPLLPLGTYRVTAEVAGFKKLTREGITLTTGQTATIDFKTGDGSRHRANYHHLGCPDC